MTSPNSSQDNPPGGPDSEPAASNGTGLVHQYLWETEGHPMLPLQPKADQSHMTRPIRSPGTMTTSTMPPSYAYSSQYQTVGSVDPCDPAPETYGPVSPSSNRGGSQSPLRHVSTTALSMRSPSNQASLQSPGSWTEAPSESTYFSQSPPRSNSNFSRTTAP